MDKLRIALANRYDGYWEFLATAVGLPESLALTIRELSNQSLLNDDGFSNWTTSERVEALCAWNPAKLVDIAAGWHRPEDEMAPKRSSAWRTAMRYLKAAGAITRNDVDVSDLRSEVEALWGVAPEAITWGGALDIIRKLPLFNYDMVRRLSRAELKGPFPSVTELLQSPVWMLPLLRGRTQCLSHDAKRFLLDTAEQCLGGNLRKESFVAKEWTPTGQDHCRLTMDRPYRTIADTPFEGNLSDAPPILELCREISPDHRLMLADRLAAKINEVSDARIVAPAAYILAADWRLP